MSRLKVIFKLFTTVCCYLFSEGIDYLKRSISIWVKPKPRDMLLINISDAEIRQLNYERFYYPCPIVQKRIHAVYLKAAFGLPDTMIGQLTGDHYGALPLKIVLDNARYQHCRLVEKAAKELNIDLLFLPSYSPNLNIIERLWKFTKKTILYAKYYETPYRFHAAINGFFQTVNQKYNDDLKNLLTLKFQFFDNQNVLIYPV